MQSVQCCTYCRDSIYLVSPMMRHDRKFNKRRKGLRSLARSPFSFWNALIVQYFCLPHPHTSKSSHAVLIIASFQQTLAKHPAVVCTLCCPLPLLFLSGDWARCAGMFWVCFKRRRSCAGACTQWCLQQPTAALPVLPLTSLQQIIIEHHCLTHTLSKTMGSSSVPATRSCWPNDSNILFWTMSCLA